MTATGSVGVELRDDAIEDRHRRVGEVRWPEIGFDVGWQRGHRRPGAPGRDPLVGVAYVYAGVPFRANSLRSRLKLVCRPRCGSKWWLSRSAQRLLLKASGRDVVDVGTGAHGDDPETRGRVAVGQQLVDDPV